MNRTNQDKTMIKDINRIPSPCYVMEEELLRKNLRLIKRVADAAGVEIILAFKAFREK